MATNGLFAFYRHIMVRIRPFLDPNRGFHVSLTGKCLIIKLSRHRPPPTLSIHSLLSLVLLGDGRQLAVAKLFIGCRLSVAQHCTDLS